MADGGGRSSGSSLQGEHEIKSTTRGQFSEKQWVSQNSETIFFNVTRFGGPTELSRTLNSENLCGRVALRFFRVTPDKNFLI